LSCSSQTPGIFSHCRLRAAAGLRRDGPYVQHHPDWEPLYSRLIDLYDQITRKALENEQRG